MVWNGSGSASLITIAQGINELTNGVLGVFIILLVVGGIYFGSRREPTREAFIAATWAGVFVGVLLRVLHMLSDVYLGFIIVLAIGATVMLVNRE